MGNSPSAVREESESEGALPRGRGRTIGDGAGPGRGSDGGTGSRWATAASAARRRMPAAVGERSGEGARESLATILNGQKGELEEIRGQQTRGLAEM